MTDAREKQTKEFTNLLGEDVKYSCTPFGAKKTVSLTPKVMRLISPVGHMVDVVDSLDDIEEQDLKGEAIVHTVEALADFVESEGYDFIEDLLGATRRKGPEDEGYNKLEGSYFQNAYKANMTELARAIFFVIQTNWAGFLKKFAGDRSLGEVVKGKIATLRDSSDDSNNSQNDLK